MIRDIAKEGRDELAKSKSWPRKAADYAKANSLTAESKDVLAALGRRLDRNEALDGYIKWQLLSFNPDFSQAGSREWESLVRGMPELIRRAEPTASDRRVLAAAEQQGNERTADRLRELITAYETEVAQTAELSTPAVKYRDALISNVPEANGTRMLVRIMDIEHRYVAGHDSFAAAVRSLLSDAKRLKDDDKTLPPPARQRIVAEVTRLRALKNPIVEDYNLMASGQVNTVPFPAVFRGRDYDTLMGDLGAGDDKKK